MIARAWDWARDWAEMKVLHLDIPKKRIVWVLKKAIDRMVEKPQEKATARKRSRQPIGRVRSDAAAQTVKYGRMSATRHQAAQQRKAG
jgi:hypothetical protein